MMEKNNMLPRICRECGRTFMGGPRAWYCPECREGRRKKAEKEFRERRRAGKVIPNGSLIKCEICGKEMIKNGGLHRFCDECAKIHLKEVDNAQSLSWKRENPEKVKESKRKASKRRCAEPGKESGRVGVRWDKGKRRWRAYINFKGKQYLLLQTSDKDRAIQIRNEAEDVIKNGNFETWIKMKRGKMDKIIDLIQDALKYEDYNFRINLIIAGLISEENNDTPEKEKQNREWLEEIKKFCDCYDGEKKEYIAHIKETIERFLKSN